MSDDLDGTPEHLKDNPAIAHFLPRQLAERWSMAVGTLANWRHLGVGPRYMKQGKGRTGRIKYPRSGVLNYEKLHNLRSTSATKGE